MGKITVIPIEPRTKPPAIRARSPVLRGSPICPFSRHKHKSVVPRNT